MGIARLLLVRHLGVLSARQERGSFGIALPGGHVAESVEVVRERGLCRLRAEDHEKVRTLLDLGGKYLVGGLEDAVDHAALVNLIKVIHLFLHC